MLLPFQSDPWNSASKWYFSHASILFILVCGTARSTHLSSLTIAIRSSKGIMGVLFLWSVGRIVFLLPHPKGTVPRPPFPAALHRCPDTVRHSAGPHEPVRKEWLAGRAGAGVYHLHRPRSTGIPLLRRTQGGQAVPRTGAARPHRAQTPWSGQTQPDLRQGLFVWTAKSAILVQPKPQANKTDKNKTEWNDSDPIYSESIREQLEDYFYQALEVELLLRLFPDDEDTIYQIVDLLVDTCSTKRKMLRIAGDDKPAEVVRSRLKKLNADHIRFVLDSLAENIAPVRNMKQYLLAMLYNAPTTMNLYYQNKTNHDFARGSPKAG